MRLITQRELERRVVEAYMSGMSYDDMQSEFGISLRRIKSILHKHGVMGKKRFMTKVCGWNYSDGHTSYRTTVPLPVCKKLKIGDGDLIYWDVREVDGELVAVVRKVDGMAKKEFE